MTVGLLEFPLWNPASVLPTSTARRLQLIFNGFRQLPFTSDENWRRLLFKVAEEEKEEKRNTTINLAHAKKISGRGSFIRTTCCFRTHKRTVNITAGWTSFIIPFCSQIVLTRVLFRSRSPLMSHSHWQWPQADKQPDRINKFHWSWMS